MSRQEAPRRPEQIACTLRSSCCFLLTKFRGTEGVVDPLPVTFILRSERRAVSR